MHEAIFIRTLEIKLILLKDSLFNLFVEKISKHLPIINKWVEKIFGLLKTKSVTSEDIIRKRMPKTFIEKDDTKATYNLKISDTSLTQSNENLSMTNSSNEIYLKQIMEDFKESTERKNSKMKEIYRQEKIIFTITTVAAILALGLIIWGSWIIFFKKLNVFAVLSELVGLVSGAGTVILWRLQSELKEKANKIEKEQEEQTKYLRSIQIALASGGTQREEILKETSKWLQNTIPQKK